MPDKVQGRFKVLKVLSDKRSKLSDEFDAEIKAIEAKILDKKRPLYQIRQQIIEGEVTEFSTYKADFATHHAELETYHAENLTKKKASEEPQEEEEVKAIDVENLKGKQGIPDFWYRSIKNNQMIFELVKEKDEPILEKHLLKVESEKQEPDTADAKSRKALTIKFHFSENEYFPEKVLALKVIYKPNTEDEVERIEGTPISWADESKDPTKKKIKKK